MVIDGSVIVQNGNIRYPGVLITESDGSTDVDESGPTQDTYDVVLTSPPSGDVVVTVTSTDILTGVTVDATSLLFNGMTWNTPKTVAVTAVDDSSTEGTPHITMINHDIDAGLTLDDDYDALAGTLESVTAYISDND